MRLPFGGAACPSEFCLVSDIITDTINDLLAYDDWDPVEVHSKYVDKIPPAKKLSNDTLFPEAKKMSVISSFKGD